MGCFHCGKCGARATHQTPLTGTSEVPLHAYRCPIHKGRGYVPIPGVGWMPSRLRRAGRGGARRGSRR